MPCVGALAQDDMSGHWERRQDRYRTHQYLLCSCSADAVQGGAERGAPPEAHSGKQNAHAL